MDIAASIINNLAENLSKHKSIVCLGLRPSAQPIYTLDHTFDRIFFIGNSEIFHSIKNISIYQTKSLIPSNSILLFINWRILINCLILHI